MNRLYLSIKSLYRKTFISFTGDRKKDIKIILLRTYSLFGIIFFFTSFISFLNVPNLNSEATVVNGVLMDHTIRRSRRGGLKPVDITVGGEILKFYTTDIALRELLENKEGSSVRVWSVPYIKFFLTVNRIVEMDIDGIKVLEDGRYDDIGTKYPKKRSYFWVVLFAFITVAPLLRVNWIINKNTYMKGVGDK